MGDGTLRYARSRLLVAFVCGLVFGAGLLLSGMTRPAKVLAFLDPLGTWDPSLALVMAGAVSTYAVGIRWGNSWRRRLAPLAAPSLSAPPVRRVDAALLVGAAIFGVGWGIGGYCPGPSLVAIASGATGVLVFVGCMLLGSVAATLLERPPQPSRARRDSEALQS
jgi:uncharacterized membrane protein YedE/YeeE